MAQTEPPLFPLLTPFKAFVEQTRFLRQSKTCRFPVPTYCNVVDRAWRVRLLSLLICDTTFHCVPWFPTQMKTRYSKTKTLHEQQHYYHVYKCVEIIECAWLWDNTYKPDKWKQDMKTITAFSCISRLSRVWYAAAILWSGFGELMIGTLPRNWTFLFLQNDLLFSKQKQNATSIWRQLPKQPHNFNGFFISFCSLSSRLCWYFNMWT